MAIVMEAVKNCGFVLQIARDVVMEAVENYHHALMYASEDLKGDSKVPTYLCRTSSAHSWMRVSSCG
jgi:hypothetical protein